MAQDSKFERLKNFVNFRTDQTTEEQKQLEIEKKANKAAVVNNLKAMLQSEDSTQKNNRSEKGRAISPEKERREKSFNSRFH